MSMMIASTRALLVCTLASLLSLHAVRADKPGYSWELSDAQSGMRVFTSSVVRHGFDAIKVSAALPVSATRLLSVLLAFDAYTQWYHDAAEVRMLSQPATLAHIPVRADGSFEHVPSMGPWQLFFRQRTPPLADRWTILRADMRAGVNGSLLIEFHSVQKPFTAPDDAVRMDLRGYWQLRPIGPMRTEVNFVIDVDPNTSVPAFLVDPRLQEVAMQTLTALEKQAKVKHKAAAAGGETL